MKSDIKAALRVASLCTIAGACTLAQGGVVSSIVLDNFDSDPNTGAGGPGTYSTQIFDNPFSQSASFTLNTAFNDGTNQGVLIFDSGIGVKQGASILYNNSGTGLNLNAAAMGATGFEFSFLQVDQSFMMRFEMSNNGDGPSGMAGVASYDVLVNAGMGQTISAAFGDFIISPGFDINDVDDIKLSFNLEGNATASLDFVASQFSLTVPAPGSLALLGLGSLAAVRRRR